MSGQSYSVLCAKEPRNVHCGLLKRVESVLLVLIDLRWSTEALQHNTKKVSKKYQNVITKKNTLI